MTTATRILGPAEALALDLARPVLLRDGYDPGVASSACGDHSLTDEPCAYAVWAMPEDYDTRYVAVQVWYYVTAHVLPSDGADEIRDLDYSDWHEIKSDESEDGHPDVPNLRYAVRCQTMWIACNDADEPGSSEVRSDYQDEDVSASWIHDVDQALRNAQNRAHGEDWSNYDPENFR